VCESTVQFDKSLKYPHRQVTKDLAVLAEVKVAQTVTVLPGGVVQLKTLSIHQHFITSRQ